MTINLTKSLDDFLEDIGINDARLLQMIDYGAAAEFISKERGMFRIEFVPEDHPVWSESSKRFGEFLRLRFPKGYFDAVDIRHNPFWMLVENSLIWGHDGDKKKEIEIQCYFSTEGFVLSVKDQGPGFDVKDVVTKMRAGERYFRNGGSAFYTMENDPSNTYSYNVTGNEAYMLSITPEAPIKRS